MFRYDPRSGSSREQATQPITVVMSAPPTREDLEEGLKGVSAFERAACGWSVRRQLMLRPRAPHELERYGVEGAVMLAVGRCFLLYGLILGIASTVLAVGGFGGGFLAVYLAFLVPTGWGAFRAASAGRAGRRWRAFQ